MQKLVAKAQSEQQQKQARHAVALFYNVSRALIRVPDDNNRAEAGNLSGNATMQARPDPVVLSPSLVPDQAQPVAQSITDKTNLSGDVNRNKSNTVAKTGCSWVFVYETLNNEIKLRHYSPKTLKS